MDKKPFKKIVLVTTETVDARGAELTALKLAKRTGAKVLLVDSVLTPFHLPHLPDLTTETMIDTAVRVKKNYLESISEQFRAEKIEVETKVLMSSRTSEDIVGLVLSEGCDLVVRYLKGEHSRTQSRFGQTARNLMRVCPVPLLLVVDTVIDDPNILACVNAEHGIEENQSIFNAAVNLSETKLKLSAMYCWDVDVSTYLAEETDESLYTILPEETDEIFQQIQADFNDKYDLSEFRNRVLIEKGNPVRIIPDYCGKHSIDVAVMSSASLNHPLDRLMGSTIEGLIEQIPCAILVVKPLGFKSPVEDLIDLAKLA